MTIRSVEICDACLRPRNPDEKNWFSEGDVSLCGPCKRTAERFESNVSVVPIDEYFLALNWDFASEGAAT